MSSPTWTEDHGRRDHGVHCDRQRKRDTVSLPSLWKDDERMVDVRVRQIQEEFFHVQRTPEELFIEIATAQIPITGTSTNVCNNASRPKPIPRILEDIDEWETSIPQEPFRERIVEQLEVRGPVGKEMCDNRNFDKELKWQEVDVEREVRRIQCPRLTDSSWKHTRLPLPQRSATGKGQRSVYDMHQVW